MKNNNNAMNEMKNTSETMYDEFSTQFLLYYQ